MALALAVESPPPPYTPFYMQDPTCAVLPLTLKPKLEPERSMKRRHIASLALAPRSEHRPIHSLTPSRKPTHFRSFSLPTPPPPPPPPKESPPVPPKEPPPKSPRRALVKALSTWLEEDKDEVAARGERARIQETLAQQRKELEKLERLEEDLLRQRTELEEEVRRHRLFIRMSRRTRSVDEVSWLILD